MVHSVVSALRALQPLDESTGLVGALALGGLLGLDGFDNQIETRFNDGLPGPG